MWGAHCDLAEVMQRDLVLGVQLPGQGDSDKMSHWESSKQQYPNPMQTLWQQQDLLFLPDDLFEATLSKITIIINSSSHDRR